MENKDDTFKPALIDARAAARLCMLAPDEAELQSLERQFQQIVDFAGELTSLRRETPDEPRMMPVHSAMREDIPGESLSHDDVLMNAKTVSGSMITVPRTFD